jgi:hypothetical protein
MPVPLMPANEPIENEVAQLGRAVIESEAPACLKRAERWRERQRSKDIKIAADIFPTHRNNGAKANIASAIGLEGNTSDLAVAEGDPQCSRPSGITE